MKKKRWSNCLSIALLAAIGGMSLLIDDTAAGTKTVVYSRPLVDQMDPAISGKSEGAQNMSQVYDTLVMLDKDGNAVPGLAESWEISPDFKTYIFHLRKGVTFHDGSPFTADAVKFSFDRLLRVNRAAYGYYLKYGQPEGCRVIDDHTIQINLKEPFPIFIVDLTIGAYSIVSPDYVKKHAAADDPDALKWMTSHACGTGPFKLTEFTQGQRLVFEKFDGYWGKEFATKPAAKIDTLIFKVVEDPSNARLLLEKGDIDAAEKLTVEQFEKLRSHSDIRVLDFPMPKVVYLTMDVSQPPFNDVNVRKAVSHAINTEEIIEYIEKGKAARMHGLIPDGIMGHNPELPVYEYNVEKAKQYLAQSKYPDGFTTDLIFAVERRPEFEQAVTYIQAYLKKIGIQVNIQKMAFDVQLPKMEKGSYGLSLMTWSTVLPDAEDIAGWLYDSARSSGGWNGAHWDNKEVQAMVGKAREIEDQAERKRLYQEVDMIAVEQAVYVNLYQLSAQFATRKNLTGFSFDPLVKVHFWEVDK